MNSTPATPPKKTPIEDVDEETQKDIAREGGPRAASETVGHGFNADDPPGDRADQDNYPPPSTEHKWEEPGESQYRLEPEDQDEPLEHAGASESDATDIDGGDKVVKGRPPLKELAELGNDEQGDAEDQDEDYQPRDEITPG